MPKKSLEVEVEGHVLELTNLEKVLYPKTNITKGEFIEYYEKVADYMLPHLHGRLLTLRRFPGGISEHPFYQKNAQDYFPPWINRVPVHLESVGTQTYITCENKETLIFLANLVTELHVWTSRVDKLMYPDRLIFDLDPGGKDFEPARQVALILRELLKKTGMNSFPMLTGSMGAHVVVPLDRSAGFEQVRAFASEVSHLVESLYPELVTTEYRKDKRGGRLFIDIYRNSFAQTAIAPYAVRARPGASVAAPLDWRDIKNGKIVSNSFTISDLPPRLKKKGDPWKNIFSTVFSLEGPSRLLKKLLKK